MEKAEYILSLVGTILSCMAGILTIGIKLIKALKEVKEKINKEKITEKLPELIEEAEKFIGYSGKEKKEYVMDKIGEYAEELGIKADLQFVSEKIEELVKLTKGVNMYEKKEKD
mgnify:FL=1